MEFFFGTFRSLDQVTNRCIKLNANIEITLVVKTATSAKQNERRNKQPRSPPW